MSLSKLHVRFIQSQQQFHISTTGASADISFPISSLYVKDNTHFYLMLTDETLPDVPQIQLHFTHKTPALNSLTCTVQVIILNPGSEDFEDAALFFHIQPDKISRILLLELSDLSSQ